ncbi:helix-hairpin-helix domain-containing protein [bacterium]|nr:helix-hairpin-helix domain-containing protein [bacterium]
MEPKPSRSPWYVMERDQALLYLLCALLVAALCVRAARERSKTRRTVRKIGATRDIRYRIDINRADTAELDLLPGIGATFAERIVAFRKKNGPFRTAEDLSRVPGLSADRVKTLQPLITAGTATTGGDPRP